MLSILIVNWNTRDLLLACLRSLWRFRPVFEVETIVVDNASGDGSAEAVESEFPWVRLVRAGRNLGYAAGNNLAFLNAQGDWLLTLNPDTEFDDDTLQRSVETLIDKPTYGALGVRLVGPEGETQRSVRGFPSLAGVLGAATGLDRLFPSSPLGSYSLPTFDYAADGPAPQPMGTFLLFRRAALEAVGDPSRPFDERFPIFFNEVDLLYRLGQAGWPCWYSSQCHVRHHHGASTRQVRKSMIWESHESLVRYLHKHSRGPQRLLLPAVALAVRAGAFARAKGYHAGFRPDHNNL
ncbi:MAG: glycosyltransferase family 2 protein [Fimbriimonadaceae bacterium]|nr:glycosyltransferase family 2 protein [Fimbriimonadaceae bacterium]QYK55411.1 MAG: glycosyltransferase family 2 protein [Fimbriimonadaceae bacterium]